MGAGDVLLDMATELVEQIERMNWPGDRVSDWYAGRLLGFELAAMRLCGAGFDDYAARFKVLARRSCEALTAKRRAALDELTAEFHGQGKADA